jgi:CelD/BcsL family acetyltransferase involved in cellulose biosynthesis
MRVEEVTDRARLAALQGPWRKLIESAPQGDMFQTCEWVTSWLDCFWIDRPISFLFVWEGEELVGLAPLLRDRDATVACRNSMSLPVNAHSRRLGVLYKGDPSAVLKAILEHARTSGQTVRLTLRQSLEDAPLPSVLPIVARRMQLASMQLPSRICPFVRIDSTWEEYLASRPAQVSRELKRKVRKIERDWKAVWTIASTPAECARAMDDIRAIERKSWKEGNGTSLTAEQSAVRLYEDFAPRFAQAGWLRIYLLHLDGVPVAHILGAEFRREYYALKTSYDQDFRLASPGQALFFTALKDSFERKLTAFDFLGDESRWKSELANAERRHVDVCAHSRFDPHCSWHTLLETTLKPLAKELAPGLVALRNRFRPPAPAKAPPGSPPPPPVVRSPEDPPLRQAG